VYLRAMIVQRLSGGAAAAAAEHHLQASSINAAAVMRG